MSLDHWYVQSSGLNTGDSEVRIIDGLQAANIGFTDFGVVPFTNEITGLDDITESGFLHCSTKVLRILTDETVYISEVFPNLHSNDAHRLYDTLKRGIFYDVRKFDQAYYLNVVGRSLLNFDAAVAEAADVLDRSLDHDVFMKPTSDLKLFKGGVVPAGKTLRQFVSESTLDVSFDAEVSKGATVLYAPLKEIVSEYRFFIVNGDVITGSQYMDRGTVKYAGFIPADFFRAAHAFARVYEPAKAFTMDLCKTSDGEISIVEYNCVNCSGLYHANIQALAESLSSRY